MKQSCEVYRRFGNDWITRLQQLDLPLLIFYAPQEAKVSIQTWLGQEHQYFAQQGEDLGARMTHAFETGFDLGFDELMIFGSDSPDLPLDIIRQGLTAIRQGQVAIGPSNDGGYYTIGLQKTQWFSGLFQNIEWSTETVYPKTLDILNERDLPVLSLPQWDDVDTLIDLRAFYDRIVQHQDLPQTLNYLQGHLMHELEAG